MGIICGEVQLSDHTISSFCEEKYNYAIHCNLRVDLKKCSELLSDYQLATEGSGREMERISIDEVFFRLRHRITHAARSEGHPI